MGVIESLAGKGQPHSLAPGNNVCHRMITHWNSQPLERKWLGQGGEAGARGSPLQGEGHPASPKARTLNHAGVFGDLVTLVSAIRMKPEFSLLNPTGTTLRVTDVGVSIGSEVLPELILGEWEVLRVDHAQASPREGTEFVEFSFTRSLAYHVDSSP